MTARITHTSYVIDFLDINFKSDKISEVLVLEVNEFLRGTNLPNLENWEVVFKALYTKKDNILMYRKTRSHSKEKYKEIVIHIPIPLNSVVPWGVTSSQHIQLGRNENFEKYVDKIEIDPTVFEDRTSYILACMRNAIKKCFELGFTVNGCKIKPHKTKNR